VLRLAAALHEARAWEERASPGAASGVHPPPDLPLLRTPAGASASSALQRALTANPMRYTLMYGPGAGRIGRWSSPEVYP
jgi:hypothetical protein